MKQKRLKYQKLITFSRWSRKKYAVLVSLGKQIKIGNVRFEICDLALLKSDKLQFQVFSGTAERSEDKFSDDEIDSYLLELISIQLTANPESSAYLHNRNLSFNNNHCLILNSSLRGTKQSLPIQCIRLLFR